MSTNPHPFLRFELLKFQIHSPKQIVDLNKLKIEVELREKHQSNQPCISFLFIFLIFENVLARIKKPSYNENIQSIRFDAGLLNNIEREMFVRIMFNDILYQFQSDLKSLQKLADGFRHQINFSPKAHAELIVEYKDPSASNENVISTRLHGRRYAERYQNVHKHFGHKFVAKIFKSPTFCSTCGEILW